MEWDNTLVVSTFYSPKRRSAHAVDAVQHPVPTLALWPSFMQASRRFRRAALFRLMISNPPRSGMPSSFTAAIDPDGWDSGAANRRAFHFRF
jgi:hypothetical protein